MKSFLKYTLATVVGLILFSIISVLLMVGSVAASMATVADSQTEPIVENSVLNIDLDGMLTERQSTDKTAFIMSKLQDKDEAPTLEGILSAIKEAKTNQKINGIYLDCESFGAAPASLEAIRNQLIDFKTSGKFIVSYSDAYTQGSYYLASVGDKIWLNPSGVLGLRGLGMNVMFYQKALDNLGINFQVFKVGTYKSAVEPYIRMNMSEPNQEQMTHLAFGLWNHMIENMASSRQISPDAFNKYADSGAFIHLTPEVISDGFIDSLIYESSVKDLIKAMNKDKKVNYTSCDDVNKTLKADAHKDKIAVLYAVGAIDGTGDGIKSEKIVKELLKLKDDDNIKAVVLRVNSPGGSAFGSEQMWHAAELLKAEKPLVVSMGDYAASGGYYMSCNADYIFAQPNTITGSIGIFGLVPNATRLTKFIGVNWDGVSTNKYSAMGSTPCGFTEQEGLLMQQSVNEGYELFTSRVAEGRHMSQDKVKSIGEGRVWLGTDGIELGLVDKIGGLDDAIAEAASRAKVTEYGVKSYPKAEDMMMQIISEFTGNTRLKMINILLGDQAQYFNQIDELKNMDHLQARLPYIIQINN